MEEKTYSFRDISTKLYELEYNGTASDAIKYKVGKRRKSKNDETVELDPDDFYNWKRKQYKRLKMASGIPKYPHRDIGDEYQFSENKYLEVLFTLYYYDAPFMSKNRSMHAINLDVVEDINIKFRAFITALFSDVYTEAEINKHIELFSYATSLDHEVIYDKIQQLTRKHLGFTNKMIQWFNRSLLNSQKNEIKAINKETSSAKDEAELLEILEQHHPLYEGLIHSQELSDFCPLLNYHDKSVILQKYLDLVEQLLILPDISDTDKIAHLLYINIQYKKIVHIFSELRDVEIEDLSIYMVDTNLPEEEHKAYLFANLKSSIDVLNEAIDEYTAKEKRRSKPPLVEDDLKEIKEFFNKPQKS